VRRWKSIALAVALTMAACGGSADQADEAPTSTVAETVEPSQSGTTETSSATSSPATSSTIADSTTTSQNTSTTSSATTTTIAADPPATFLAVTDDFRAVEVATATGEIIRDLGQLASRADFDDPGAEIAPNAIDALWRTADGTTVAVSECCEPAAGSIHYLGPDDVLTDDTRFATPGTHGWSAAPAPDANEFAVLGYSIAVLPADDVTADRYLLSVEIDAVGSWASGMPTWSRDGQTVYWIGDDVGSSEAPITLHSVDLTPEEPAASAVGLTWVQPGQALDGITTQASGNLVGFLRTIDPESFFDDLETEGVVFAPTGELVTTFPVERGARLGGYDPSGRWLIYTDGDGVARWQGIGRSGELGPGYTFVSW
jgi:hypothetical protein